MRQLLILWLGMFLCGEVGAQSPASVAELHERWIDLLRVTDGDISARTFEKVIGLQLLVYAGLGIGPIGALRPVWHTAVGFLVGVIWALVLILPSWLLSPHGQDRRAVAAVYQALAGLIVLCRAGRI